MIAIDWGTSSVRAYRLDADGGVVERRAEAASLLQCSGRFDAVLAEQIAGWDDHVVVLCGMVGSRNGWREVPYVECPAGVDEIAAGLLEIDATTLPGRRVFIAPGLSYRPDGGAPEVMRGEETQSIGLAGRLPGDGPHTACLPGTHSKWVQLRDARVVALRTAMTGELYALLRRHGLLAALMPEGSDDADDEDAFARGVDASGRDGGLTSHLFGVRTQGLFGMLAAEQAPSYLSGLLIGHELRALAPGGGATVHLVGNEALCRRYARALERLGVSWRLHGEALAAEGLFRLAVARGLAGAASGAG